MSDANDGVIGVALMALHDRSFFEELLEDPRSALERRRDEADFPQVTAAEVEVIVRLFEQRGDPDAAGKARSEALRSWDIYHTTGRWDPKTWPIYPPGRPRTPHTGA